MVLYSVDRPPKTSTSYDFEVLPSAPQLVCGCVNAGEVAERIFLRCLTILVPQNDSLSAITWQLYLFIKKGVLARRAFTKMTLAYVTIL